MITDASGNVEERRQFDAWGNIVKLTDGAGNTLTAFAILERSYTGHEHLLGVGLINMNARLYDPLLHRFLSPDDNVQNPTNTQSFNRYGYVLNNPFKYTDKNGCFFIEPSSDLLLDMYRILLKPVIGLGFCKGGLGKWFGSRYGGVFINVVFLSYRLYRCGVFCREISRERPFFGYC
ncbi:RHS repeat-associated core domain-containing protein [Mucilaginibacter panaciglaebae]|uniref:RHS repeat domain-containing protein n=1 Tax=Mucilaginibacter panaciglaebae TaxID=502331 RepID=UPI0031E5844D